LKGNQSTVTTHEPISFRMVEYDYCYDRMMNSFVIILIETKLNICKFNHFNSFHSYKLKTLFF